MILMIKRAPWLLSVPATLIYFLLIHPLILILLAIDYGATNRNGNGLFIKAVRNLSKGDGENGSPAFLTVDGN